MMSSAKRVAIVGAGELGSRHLQSLAGLSAPVKIQVVEPSETSRRLASERWAASLGFEKHQVEYVASIQDLSIEQDLVIVATNAGIRFQLTTELLARLECKAYILEKVLFQSTKQYADFRAVLLQHPDVTIWVNHPRRCFPFYREMRSTIGKNLSVNLHVIGGGWGFASNATHFLDLLRYLSGDSGTLRFDLGLEPQLVDAKRAGYKEFFGRISVGVVNTGHKALLECRHETTPLTLLVSTEAQVWMIDEAAGWLRTAKAVDGWKWEEKSERIVRYQSELTGLLAADIFSSGRCDLPQWDDVADIHEGLVSEVLAYVTKHSGFRGETLPIT